MRFNLVLFLFICIHAYGQNEVLSLYEKGETMTYDQAIDFYRSLDEKYKIASLIEMGESDYGKPIYLFLIHPNHHNPEEIDFENETTLLINNAIHPGEPCGVDACADLAHNVLFESKYVKGSKINVNIGIIPVYNIGGAHNRGSESRANQIGPKEHGFRGNAKNLDLNRDFIKCDSKNTLVFSKIFRWLQPQLFVDTHTSNGADYQHTMTLITSQRNKMHPLLKDYVDNKLNPYLFQQMKEKENPMSPYVNSIGRTPDTGIQDYLETPRYSTGYTNLFNCISYVTEAHMLKPYKDRVEATKDILYSILSFAEFNKQELFELKKKADSSAKNTKQFGIEFKLDTTKSNTIEFLGYEYELIESSLTSEKRLKYDQNKPKTYEINYYNTYKSSKQRKKPKFYIIPRQWTDVIELLKVNNINMSEIQSDSIIEVNAYYIEDFETAKYPYEGHYLHKNIEIKESKYSFQAKKGDLLVPTGKSYDYFLVSVLEPDATDSYFAWNFFDAILGRKEYFSPYVFEEKAIEILNNNPQLKKEYELKKADFDSRWSALDYIYRNSKMYETTHNLYPIFRLD